MFTVAISLSYLDVLIIFIYLLIFLEGLETNKYNPKNSCYKEIYGTLFVLCESSSPHHIKRPYFLDGYV